MDKLDEGLKTLLDLGKRRGFLTFDQVNDYLPDEAASPERIHGLLETLDAYTPASAQTYSITIHADQD